MGSKGLKAIAIQGSGKINVFDNESLMATVNKINRESDKSVSAAYVTAGHAKQTYSVTSRKTPCTMGCQAYCGWPTFQTNNLAQTGQALPVDITASDFCFGISASVGYEANYICNQLGINGWEFAYGMQPVLEYASQQHILTQVDGIPIPAPTYTIINGRKDTMSNTLVATLLNKLAYRSDPLGDAMAEGVVLMAQKLWPTYPGSAFTNVDTVLTRAYPGYPAFSSGMTGHWDCHWAHTQLKYPHWLVSALIWSVANRDPADDSVHSWGENVANWWGKPMCDGTNLSWPDRIAPVSQRLYGTTQTMDPNISFDPPEAKAYGARFHKWHGALTSSLLLCDWQMPRVFSIRNMPDPHTYPQAESEMFSAVTGINTTEQAMLTDGERICNLERAIDVRYGRKRAWDEAVIPYFSEPSGDTVVDYKTAFNANKFKAQITAMYTMFGWDTVTGWPKRAKLESLGLKYVADGLASIGKPPI
jgi:aldehyde:ferredoxin oxidoreductase